MADEAPVRISRSKLVDESVKGPRRPPRAEEIERAALLASRRPASAIVILCDSDDDCPATWGPQAAAIAGKIVPAAAVMATREFEAWILYGCWTQQQRLEAGVPNPGLVRDAKSQVRKLHAGYKPTLHQAELTKRIKLQRARDASTSFDKLYRDIKRIVS